MNRHGTDDQPPTRAASSSDVLTDPSSSLQVLPTRDHARLRLLALHYHIRSNGTLRPVADVTYDLRTLHGIELTPRQVFELLSRKPGSAVGTAL